MPEEHQCNVNNTILYEELKSLYNQQWDAKKTLESKANNIITIAGTIITLLFGFSTFAKDFLMPSIYFPLYIIMASAISSAISILISALLHN
jgi:hypothetical protein